MSFFQPPNTLVDTYNDIDYPDNNQKTKTGTESESDFDHSIFLLKTAGYSQRIQGQLFLPSLHFDDNTSQSTAFSSELANSITDSKEKTKNILINEINETILGGKTIVDSLYFRNDLLSVSKIQTNAFLTSHLQAIEANSFNISEMKPKTDVITLLTEGGTYQKHNINFRNRTDNSNVGYIGTSGDTMYIGCSGEKNLVINPDYGSVSMYCGDMFLGDDKKPARLILRAHSSLGGGVIEIKSSGKPDNRITNIDGELYIQSDSKINFGKVGVSNTPIIMDTSTGNIILNSIQLNGENQNKAYTDIDKEKVNLIDDMKTKTDLIQNINTTNKEYETDYTVLYRRLFTPEISIGIIGEKPPQDPYMIDIGRIGKSGNDILLQALGTAKILLTSTANILITAPSVIFSSSIQLKNEIQNFALTDTKNELLSHFLTYSPTAFYIYGNDNRSIVMHSGTGSVQLWTETVQIGNALGGKIVMNGETQNYAFTNANRTQISTNTNSINANRTLINTHLTYITSNSADVIEHRQTLYQIGLKLNTIEADINNIESSISNIEARIHFRSQILSDAMGVNLVNSSGGLGSINGHVDNVIGAVLLNNFYGNSYSLLSITANMDWISQNNAFLYKMQCQILIVTANNNIVYSSEKRGIRSATSGSVTFTEYGFENSVILPWQSNFLGCRIILRTFNYISTPSTGSLFLRAYVRVCQI